MHVRCMIDEWESKVVSEHLASRRNGCKINRYWMIKNTMAMLMEYLTNKWNGARDIVQSMCTCLNQTEEHLSTLEANFNWRHYTIFHSEDNVEGGGNMD